jgi:hypothetical protein
MTKKQLAVVEKYEEKLLSLCGMGDNEAAHAYADDLILSALDELGFGQLSKAWRKVENDVGFWYA